MDRSTHQIVGLFGCALAACFNPTDTDPETTSTAGSSGASSTTTLSSSSSTSAATTGGPTTGAPTTDPSTGSTAGPTSDATTGTASGSTTGAPATCDDEVANGDETDVDCGGGTCPACAADKMCGENADCASMACLGGLCFGAPECWVDAECDAAVCNTAICQDFVCVGAPLDGDPCDDDLLCTASGTCLMGACEVPAPAPVPLGDVADAIKIDGVVDGGRAGTKVVALGDFNGDAEMDFGILALKGGGVYARIYVVHGGPGLADVDLTKVALGEGGGVLIEVDTNTNDSVALSAAGDFNGDGRMDVLIGTKFDKNNKGGAHVVFGTPDTAKIKLGALQVGQGISIPNTAVNMTGFGAAVTGLGELNNDAYADVAVAAPSENGTGAVYVVYGDQNPSSASIQQLVTQNDARRIEGPSTFDFGTVIAGVGDINGDGVPDLAVGQPGHNTGRGRIFVLYLPAVIPTPYKVVLPLGNGTGFTLVNDSLVLNEFFGASIAAAGDFNGDTVADFVASGSGTYNRAVVLFGKDTLSGDIVESQLVNSQRGFIVTGAPGERLGLSVAGGLDVSGDARSDVVLGAGSVADQGRVVVAFGRDTAAKVSSSTLAAGTGGFIVDGEMVTNGLAGASVALTPSVDGDSRAELVFSAPGLVMSNRGRVYLVHGSDCAP